MLNQGPRPDEAVSLLKTDVDPEHRKMYIRKGKSRAARRKLDLTAEGEIWLDRVRDPSIGEKS